VTGIGLKRPSTSTKRQMAQKGIVGKHSVKAFRVPPRHPGFTKFLAKKLMEAIPSQWRGL
jgi:hypothetical protein